MKAVLNDWKFLVFASLTLGLAPFYPEPHILGKLRWVAGGANGMEFLDWFDLFFHGLPWLLLIRLGLFKLFKKGLLSKNKDTMTLLVFLPLLFSSCIKSTDNQQVNHSKQESWSYEGSHSADHWADLSPEFVKCAEGHFQSPIDIESYVTKEHPGSILNFKYHPSHVDIINNGHTIQANLEEENALIVDDKAYELKQIHFHEPSEHRVDGIVYPMEMHLVHTNSSGKLAVIGVFIKEGKSNPVLQAMWEELPEEKGIHIHPNDFIDLPHLLPLSSLIYHYPGSLTTPPCSEGVEWFIMKDPITMSKAQIKKFIHFYHGNNRPIQETGNRVVESVNN